MDFMLITDIKVNGVSFRGLIYFAFFYLLMNRLIQKTKRSLKNFYLFTFLFKSLYLTLKHRVFLFFNYSKDDKVQKNV